MSIDDWQGNETAEQDLVRLRLLTHNSRLLEERKAKGVTQKQMASNIGMTAVHLSNIETLKFVPTLDEQVKIAVYLMRDIEYLFPESLIEAIKVGVFSHRDIKLKEPQVVSLTELTRAELRRLAYDDTKMIADIDRQFLRQQVAEVMGTLQPREREVLRLRFGFDDRESLTLEAVGKKMGLSRGRIQQIEEKALRKLRRPSHPRRLKDYL